MHVWRAFSRPSSPCATSGPWQSATRRNANGVASELGEAGEGEPHRGGREALRRGRPIGSRATPTPRASPWPSRGRRAPPRPSPPICAGPRGAWSSGAKSKPVARPRRVLIEFRSARSHPRSSCSYSHVARKRQGPCNPDLVARMPIAADRCVTSRCAGFPSARAATGSGVGAHTLIVFESPHRVVKALPDLNATASVPLPVPFAVTLTESADGSVDATRASSTLKPRKARCPPQQRHQVAVRYLRRRVVQHIRRHHRLGTSSYQHGHPARQRRRSDLAFGPAARPREMGNPRCRRTRDHPVWHLTSNRRQLAPTPR